MAGGRPTDYKEEYIGMVEKYLAENIDLVDIVYREGEEPKGQPSKVKLPTVEGFARFIGVPRRTIYEWRDKHVEFSHTLDKILIEQQERLINKGLAGDYNSTIAKLILSSNHGMAERKDVTSGDLPIPLLNALPIDAIPDNDGDEEDTRPKEEN